jgi:hypothetical protein
MGDVFGFEFSLKLLKIVSTEKSQKRRQLLTQPIDVHIDSLATQLWLPLDICRSFEEAFNLEWDEASELYLVNETLHTSLLERDITVDITVGQHPNQITLDFPYSMFDLKVGPPYVETKTHYFPLHRANSTYAYILGRTFLQRAYLTADHDRRIFNLSRAVYDPKAANRIFNIAPPTDAEKMQTTNPKPSNKHVRAPSQAAIAAISIGLSAVVIALCVLYYRHLRQKSLKLDEEKDKPDTTLRRSTEDSLDTGFIKAELDGKGKTRFELDASDTEKRKLEWHVTATELEGSSPIELPGFVPIYEVQEGKRYSYEENVVVAKEKLG